MREEVERGRVVIVAGFQGLTEGEDVATIGRGGSDTTAVAFAAALNGRCEIYTDVEGVYTADPRVVPDARKLNDITYEEMLELASQGAKVMAPRAVELGAVYNIPILVASSFVEAPGTLIHGGIDMEQFNRVRGIAHDLDVAKITLRGVPDRPGIAATVFEPLAEAQPLRRRHRPERLRRGADRPHLHRHQRRPRPLAAHRATRSQSKSAPASVTTDDKRRQGEHRRHRHPERAGLRLAHVPHPHRRRASTSR